MEAILDETPLFLNNINQPGLDQNNPEKKQGNESYQQEKKWVIQNRHGFPESRWRNLMEEGY